LRRPGGPKKSGPPERALLKDWSAASAVVLAPARAEVRALVQAEAPLEPAPVERPSAQALVRVPVREEAVVPVQALEPPVFRL
jgi:hypothetical protein